MEKQRLGRSHAKQMPRMKKRSSSFYNLSLGKCKPWFKGAKDLGQSRLSGESDGDVSKQFNNVCQALGETRVGRGVPLRARRLVLNRVSLCLFFFLDGVCLFCLLII